MGQKADWRGYGKVHKALTLAEMLLPVDGMNGKAMK
tara:strand:- start:419 stop:526 length:108 start_codon:yes stop_codon:yes gene_type:complete